jgi:hypothetical protein
VQRFQLGSQIKCAGNLSFEIFILDSELSVPAKDISTVVRAALRRVVDPELSASDPERLCRIAMAPVDQTS